MLSCITNASLDECVWREGKLKIRQKIEEKNNS